MSGGELISPLFALSQQTFYYPVQTPAASECQTCKNRKYKDGSNDPGVSFKTPTHLSPENAANAIRSHEGEHVSHARAQALREDQKILSQSVTYHMDTCPECGRTYMSGGTTRTVFQTSSDSYDDGLERKGAFIDIRV